MKVKTRFAPSPTGNLHIGSIRTALYSWLFARHHHGKFILRIEDTDFERSQTFSVSSILEGLQWLGLYWDEGPYFQSKRLDRYKNIINILLNKGHAYKCFCSTKKLEEEKIQQILKGEKARYNGTCRNLTVQNSSNKNYIVRFKNPLIGSVVFNDKIRGKISIENKELDDLVIQRSNGIPTYNLCVVIDDLDMEITHVIRGEDHINNTPRQINILKALGAEIPIYAHVSMICDQNGQKISKRQEAINIIEYRKNGILPEALLNYIIRLGWSHGNQEIFNIKEMQELFSLESVSKSSSIVSPKKLLWINKYYIKNLSVNYITHILKEYMDGENINIKNGPRLEYLVELLKHRNHSLKEMAQSCRYFYEEFSFFDPQAAKMYLVLSNFYILDELYKQISHIIIWEKNIISEMIDNVVKKYNLLIQEVNMILRVSLTGNMHSPSITFVIFLIGKKKTLLRIQKAIDYVKNVKNQNRN